MKAMNYRIIASLLCVLFVACEGPKKTEETADATPMSVAEKRLGIYAPVKLTTDLAQLSESDKQVIPILIEAAKIMDGLFLKEAYPQELQLDPASLTEAERKFMKINYGPWDRLDDNTPFVDGVGEKPKGAGFYPLDMKKEEFEAMEAEDKSSGYTMIRRDEAGKLITVPYHEEFAAEVKQASDLLKKAAALADNESFKKYLNLRAEALLTDSYDESDIAWMDLEGNSIDVIIGPIENYEDQLYGAKNAHEAYILVKDKVWSKRLEKYAAFMGELQNGLPVDATYKAEKPGANAQLNAYDVVYYAGDCNAGSKTIAVNLPNDEQIQISKGTRRSQLKNAMRAKFDQILVPISQTLIAEDQRKHITFDAFFGNTMFHEVAHGLGIKNTINGKGTVRAALKETNSALEEGKADILGLYMVTQLFEKGEISEGTIEDNYVTFLAGIFRSVRFGASSAHGKANMVRFNFFEEMGAFSRDEATGTYSVNMDKMREAMNSLSTVILTLQGNGDYEGVRNLLDETGVIGEDLQADLDRLDAIPVDIVFEQGVEYWDCKRLTCMRNLLIILLLFPQTLFAEAIGQNWGEVEYTSLIGGSGNWAEELFLSFLIAGLFFLVAQWIKYAAKMKRLKPLEVLPNFSEAEFVPGFREKTFHLVPEFFEEHRDDFELFWSLETTNSHIIGRIGFLHYNSSEKAIQLSFEVKPEHASHPEIAELLEKACAYLWAQWTEQEIQVIQAYIQESDLLGEALLESIGFEETGNEDDTLAFCLYRKKK